MLLGVEMNLVQQHLEGDRASEGLSFAFGFFGLMIVMFIHACKQSYFLVTRNVNRHPTSFFYTHKRHCIGGA